MTAAQLAWDLSPAPSSASSSDRRPAVSELLTGCDQDGRFLELELGRPVRVALVACGARKLSTAAPAGELYTGELFRRARRYARDRCDFWLILSAAHFVVDPARVLEPYNRRMSDLDVDQRRAWGLVTHDQVRHRLHGAGPVTIDFLAGNDYAGPWLERFAQVRPWADVRRPLQGLGIGEQLAELGRMISGPPATAGTE